ncbi:hypothetical protein [Phenylobacterium hankyongense]|uniref:hypothetical protein n=1 Tax=Phenylobacterium hankyongense TaxID=1813876 RepID=UPI001057AE6F|nr:hypothetical protein [Phenylobacterium hankyongense]
MTTIRPTGLPPVQPAVQPQRSEAARLEAQKAFFQLATGKAQAPVAAAPTALATAPVRAAAPAPRIAAPSAEPPARILRPGSLLDIRI